MQGGETKKDVSGWTVDTAMAHFLTVINERDRRYEEGKNDQKEAIKVALQNAEKSIEKAEAIAEKWRANANEWRAAMTDKDKTYLTKEASDARLMGIDKDINALTDRFDRLENRKEGLKDGLKAGWVYATAGLAALATIIGVINFFSRIISGSGH